ncbi:Filamentous hemagglutinin [Pandoraea pnomenusa]|uniref:Filamentous hemagglutinin n=1 Tax=Pandoraea pnomenusa TaxID=93220 RepID=A0ABY6WIM8_9BURK|nr:Filamentous hemagglutinin [Pandoraea pnomenusa]
MPPTSAATGLLSCPPIFVPTPARPPPTVASKPATGVPRPVALPTVCVVFVTTFVIGVIAEESDVVSCCTGALVTVCVSPVPSDWPAMPTEVTTPPSSVVTPLIGVLPSGPV